MAGYLHAVEIGNVRLEGNVFLAPMAGVSDGPFRLLCSEQGAQLTVTEMISAKAMHFRNPHTEDLLARYPGEGPLAVQIFGSEPEIMAEAAERLKDRDFDLLDINMGCPVPKIVNNREGSALMKNLPLAEEVIRQTVRASDRPVTVKIRRGFGADEENAPEFAAMAEAAGAAAVTVHGRTREQYYSGKADWGVIRRVKEAVKIPVVGNGDITDAASARAMFEETGCDAVAVGRGARGNPWLFREIAQGLAGGVPDGPPSRSALREMILRHAQMLIEVKGERTAIHQMRKHAAWYTHGLPHSSALREGTNRMETLADLAQLLGEYL